MATRRHTNTASADTRHVFITDAIRTGLPPHIAQVIAGHANINTTMGYNAVYPTETIEAHRSFITRRRTLIGQIDSGRTVLLGLPTPRPERRG
ncbi:tyrosine-type recombinase/integrase [Streptomyces sp. NPDC101733]|uniref:tyrosine-type recombinase/integrase n=1 Tax=unclassified Streptomyces TaxID=2593676 RepID=UPI003800B2AD